MGAPGMATRSRWCGAVQSSRRLGARALGVAVAVSALVSGSPRGVCGESAGSAPAEIAVGRWRAWLESPGGELPFHLDLEEDRAALINGTERIPIPAITLEGRDLALHLPHYAAVVRARASEDGRSLEGEWRKRSGPDREAVLPFRARFGNAPRFRPPSPAPPTEPPPPPRPAFDPSGRWRVQFAADEDHAVALFRRLDDGTLHGTFLTTTGDYRYLAGDTLDGLRLSCFDGAHAFLFTAKLQPDGSLRGDFWSRDSWHDTWVAERDDGAKLPDAFHQSTIVADVERASLSYPDLDGEVRRLDDPKFCGKATLYYLFGSWCPNCHDATSYLKELQAHYGPRGLKIVGLAFELAEDPARDREQLRRYIEHFEVDWPLLLAGPADKKRASAAFPWIDRVRSYPTFLFVDAGGVPRAVYTGFTGPATGSHYAELKASFEQQLESLLPTGER